MNLAIFKTLRKPTNLFVMVGVAMIFFDINYYVMSTLPGQRDLMCVIGAGLTPINVVFSFILSVMLGLMFSGFIDLYSQKKMQLGASSVSGIGLFFGTMTVFCTACTIPVISVFGAGISLSFFTDYEVWFKMASILFMGYGLFMLNRQLKGECKVCVVSQGA